MLEYMRLIATGVLLVVTCAGMSAAAVANDMQIEPEFLIWAPAPGSGESVADLSETLATLGYSVIVTDDLLGFEDLANVPAIFVLLGVYPDNYRIARGGGEEQALLGYLQEGIGNLYLEGGDFFSIDLLAGGSALIPYMLGIADADDGPTGWSLQSISGGGDGETFNFGYDKENVHVDRIVPDTGRGAQPFLREEADPLGKYVGVRMEAETHRAVAVTYEFGGLVESSPGDKERLARLIVENVFSSVDDRPDRPSRIDLAVHPSPSRRSVRIEFAVNNSGRGSLAIYDANGKLIHRLGNKTYPWGFHTASWDGCDERGREISAGVYFAKLEVGSDMLTRKIVIAK
ncbi:T9SS type A sorting domain-containing protein [Candidatus Eisenbacteria bacterium]|uniref:T9SS type A sorting domain-containing protein n=1 Tax=Eiseniibacteriota bacterium TaxID=2212470 RepID=A0ABV6YKS1_UNCEI